MPLPPAQAAGVGWISNVFHPLPFAGMVFYETDQKITYPALQANRCRYYFFPCETGMWNFDTQDGSMVLGLLTSAWGCFSRSTISR